MQAEIWDATGQILRVAPVFPDTPPTGVRVADLTPDQVDFIQAHPIGQLVLQPDGTVVVPPVLPFPTPIVPDYGTDATPDRTQLVQAVTALRQYLNVASPTAAQSAQALKLLIRVVLFLCKQLIGG